MTTDLPLALLIKTVPIYSRAVFMEQFPDSSRQTKWKGWAWERPEGVYWCARAYDKGARGGRVWRVDVDAWKGRGRAGEGWSVPMMDEGEDEDEKEEEEEDSEEEGSEAGDGGSEDEDLDAEVDDDEDDGSHARRNQKRKAASTRGRPRKKAATTRTPKKTKAKATKVKTPAKGKKAHPKASASRLPHSVEIDSLPPDPYERALRLLHVGATPESLPCREEEFVDVLSRVEEGVESGGGGCLCKSPL